jgi:phenylalanyl-tRNA synthetase beta chain
MLIPLSWLKEYVDIKLPLKDLMWKMTEVGLTCESYKKIEDEIVLDVEVTANRPDWMSIIGVAREVAAIQGIKIKEPNLKPLPGKSANFPLDLIVDFSLFDRWTGIVIKGINTKPSPDFIAKRIKEMGHEPINNIIDITNYVMFETGLPMHAFDYDEIAGQIMTVQLSKGGEAFTSVDEISYKLPKNAIIIRDSERLIDLAGIKGGLNSGIKSATKNIFLHLTINNPVLVRRTSQAMGLRSDASAIYERGPDKGGTANALRRAVSLILEYAGGEIASEMIDLKKEEFKPRKLDVDFEKMKNVLGVDIPAAESIKILKSLNLLPQKTKTGVSCMIPTYRGDIKIEEDLVEEVARIYGYNKFPMTIPTGRISEKKNPYYFDDSFMNELRQLLVASGFTEAATLSLISAGTIERFILRAEDHIKILNPVSLEYEYMRGSLIPSLGEAMKINTEEEVKLFEIDKVYPEENYKLGAIAKGMGFRKFKGVIDFILKRINIEKYEIKFEAASPYLHPSKEGSIFVGKYLICEFGYLSPQVLSNIGIKEEVLCLELDVAMLQKHSHSKTFNKIPENPAQIEDITLTFPPKTHIGDVVSLISEIDNRVISVELKDIYKDSYTFRVWYQDKKKTLSNDEVSQIRNKILEDTKRKFGGIIKG